MAKKKDKDAPPAEAGGAEAPRVRLSAHPRAARHIAMAKGWGGIAGFAIVAFFSMQAGVPAFYAVFRGLIGGIGFSTLAWAAAVAVWRQLAVAEVHAARRRMETVAEQVAAEAAKRAEAAQAAEAA